MKTSRIVIALIALSWTTWTVLAETDVPLVYPIPQQITRLETSFSLTDGIAIIVSSRATAEDWFLPRFLLAELADRYGIVGTVEQASQLPSGRPWILMGTLTDRLVVEAMRKAGIVAASPWAVSEGYVLQVDKSGVLIAGSDARGAFYGLQSLRQLIRRNADVVSIQGTRIVDWPHKPFRGIKLFLPGRDHIPFFKRFIRDFMAWHKFNKLVLEVNAGMRLDRHPELNAGWIEFANDLNYSRRDRPVGPGNQFQDSAHHDTADGRVLEKDEVADLVRFARQHYIEVIPEIPSLTHSYYLLTRHRELAEIQSAEWPDTYCPSNPNSYKLLFDVLDEYIEVMKPQMIHVGHDEWRMPIGVCALCKGKDSRQLFLDDLKKIHTHLAQQGVKTAIWGDHLMESVRGRGVEAKVSPSGFRYQTPGALWPEQVSESVPKDILIFNWFWREPDPGEENAIGGEKNDIQLSKWGFQQVYGNFTPDIQNYLRRSALAGVIGGAPSSWAVSSEFSIGKDRLFHFLGCSNLLWSTHWPDLQDLSQIIQKRMPGVRRNLSGRNLPSEDGNEIAPVKIDPARAQTVLPQITLSSKDAQIRSSRAAFDLIAAESRPSMLMARTGVSPAEPAASIDIGQDVSSLIFLHACLKAAANDWVDRYVYNPPDTADLLGFYEVLYEDGLSESVPIRYQVNILEWDWNARKKPGAYCYQGEAVEFGAAGKATFFAYEWVNPRFGKAIKEVRLRGSSNFVNTRRKPISENAVLLAAVSAVKSRQGNRK